MVEEGRVDPVYEPPRYRIRFAVLALATTLLTVEGWWWSWMLASGFDYDALISVVILGRVAVAISAILVAKKFGVTARAMGFVRPVAADLMGVALLLAFFLATAEIAYPGNFESLSRWNTESFVRRFGENVLTSVLVSSMVIIGPILSEIVFRSFMIAGLRPSHLRPVVVACSAFASGLTFLDSGPKAPLLAFVWGVALSGMFLARKSLWPGVVARVLWALFFHLRQAI